MQRSILGYTERRQYSLLVEYHELPPVFLQSLEYILELFSCPFQACSPHRQISGFCVQVPGFVCYRHYMRKTVSIPNVWAHILSIDTTLRMTSLTREISQALPPLFFRAGSKVIHVLIAQEGESNLSSRPPPLVHARKNVFLLFIRARAGEAWNQG